MPQQVATEPEDGSAGEPRPKTEVLFTRDEALGGLPARRAQALLFLIERRTVRLVEQWRTIAMLAASPEAVFSLAVVGDELLTGEPDSHDDPAAVNVFTLARERSRGLTARQIERYAPDWAPLVPSNPRIAAALAHLLGKKYRFTYAGSPTMRQALRLDTPEVQQAYQQLYGAPVVSIFVPPTTMADRLRWLTVAPGRWLEALPPFWLAFLLLLLLPLPQASLALPVAAADIGPAGGLVLLLVIAALNLLTIGYVAAAAARSSATRTGNASYGSLVADFLGGNGAALLSLSLALACGLGLLASYIGLGSTLAHFTGVPAAVWMAILFVIAVAVVSRETRRLTTGLTLGVAAVSLVLLVVVALLAFTKFHAGNFTSGPAHGVSALSSAGLSRIVGVAMMCYAGQLVLVPVARMILRRGGDGRALIRGSIAGTACMTLLLAVWLVAAGGAIPPASLAGARDTVIVPLAARVQLGTDVLGSLLTALLLGLVAVQASTALFDLVREHLPVMGSRTVVLPARRGTVVLGSGSGTGPCFGLTYLGLDGEQPRLRIDVQTAGELHQREVALAGRASDSTLVQGIPNLSLAGLRLTVESLAADATAVKLRIDSSLPATLHLDDTVSPVIDDQASSDRQRRFLLGVLPAAVVFILAVGLDWFGSPSFAGLLAFAGVVAVSVLGGVVPPLLMIAAERKSDVAANRLLGYLSRPIVAIPVASFFLALLFIHGLFIWRPLAERIVAILIGLAVLGAIVLIARRREFAPRLVIELRDDRRANGKAEFQVLAGGEPATTQVELMYPTGEQQISAAAGDLADVAMLRSATFTLPSVSARELRIRVHRIGEDEGSAVIPSQLEVCQGKEVRQFDSVLLGGRSLPIAAAAIRVKITPAAVADVATAGSE